ncbi:hypothetical protein [Kitasatospora sp. DSM 101779]|uniref:hypothetical protein n=1 Tax=Kitasatospora sp. DSM 101779 TaxID=2853165 RepID=UPI0021DA5C7B|nr:hypothetical protein [Kitasatospora sp. DSM 101779]MCU7826129.1 hypothetical protein [Kitasatospora sp. DSM 101779]
MTISPLPWLPLPATFDQVARVVGRGFEQGARATAGEELAAMHRAAAAGARAAAWVRRLAGRQAAAAHGRALEGTARVIARASSQDVVGGAGRLDEQEYRSLTAAVVLGAAGTAAPPDLHPGERTALLAACALTAAMPSTAADRRAEELPLLADELTETVASGERAGAARAARQKAVDGARLALGIDDSADPRARHAHRGVTERAFYVFELVLAHQGSQDEDARRQALTTALGPAGRGAAAAALLRVADDPALGLDDDRRHHLARLAADLDPRTTRDLTGRPRI